MVQYTPPMGWNTWNAFGDEINEQVVLDAAGGLVQSGLAAAGYRYVVIDDCWSMPERDSAGELVANPEKFLHGMRALADAIHGMGLLFGMYSCAGLPGTFDNEFRDARRFAEWGVDFLKYDSCYHTPVLQAKYHYRRMGLALAINQDAACRQVFALSPWSGNPLDTVRVRLLTDGSPAIGIFNLNDSDSQIVCAMDELGLPRTCGKKLILQEAWTGETYIPCNGVLEAHGRNSVLWGLTPSNSAVSVRLPWSG